MTNTLKHMLILMTLLLCLMGAKAQQPSTPVVIEQTAQSMAVDPQGNIYAVNDATLYKYDPDGTLLYTYNDNMLGHISSIDVDNPLKIMLFYRDAGFIIFLNDKLSPIGDKVNLFSKGLTTIGLATYSTRNELILYDESNTDLILLDFYFREKERIHYDFTEFQPIQLTNVNEKINVMQDLRQGVFFFDNFGTFDKNIAITSELPVQIVKDHILYVKDNQLNRYNYQRLERQQLCEIPEEVVQVLVYQDKIILLDDKSIKIIQQNKNQK